jgi:hypothetical protein
MTTDLAVLQCGSCEPLKAGIHATALGLFVVMGLYNAAAWLCRREQHLAINAVVYGTLIVWERQHIARHMASIHAARTLAPQPDVPASLEQIAA